MLELFTLYGVLVWGSAMFFAFWVTSIVVIVAISALVADDRWGYPVFVLAVFFVFLASSRIFDIIAAIKASPSDAVKYFLGYLFVGAVWAIFKWWLYAKDRYRQYLSERAAFFKRHKVSEWTPSLNDEWKASNRYSGLGDPPLAADHKEKIVTWLAYWPFSMLGFLIRDWIKRLFTEIYERLSGLLDSISRSVFKEV